MKRYLTKEYSVPALILLLLAIAVSLPVFVYFFDTSKNNHLFFIFVTIVAVILIALGVAIHIVFSFVYSRKNHSLRNEVKEMHTALDGVKKEAEYASEFFNSHYKIVDKTIEDQRDVIKHLMEENTELRSRN